MGIGKNSVWWLAFSELKRHLWLGMLLPSYLCKLFRMISYFRSRVDRFCSIKDQGLPHLCLEPPLWGVLVGKSCKPWNIIHFVPCRILCIGHVGSWSIQTSFIDVFRCSNSSKASMSNSIASLYWTRKLERCGSKNKHIKDKCVQENRLRAQNMLTALDLGEFTGDLSRNDMREKVGWNVFVRLKLNICLRPTSGFIECT